MQINEVSKSTDRSPTGKRRYRFRGRPMVCGHPHWLQIDLNGAPYCRLCLLAAVYVMFEDPQTQRDDRQPAGVGRTGSSTAM